MPGAYAHITHVNLIREPARLESRGFPSEAIVSLLDYFRFCELGAVSPTILISISLVPIPANGRIECTTKKRAI